MVRKYRRGGPQVLRYDSSDDWKRSHYGKFKHYGKRALGYLGTGAGLAYTGYQMYHRGRNFWRNNQWARNLAYRVAGYRNNFRVIPRYSVMSSNPRRIRLRRH